jgi:hypothetical protein
MNKTVMIVLVTIVVTLALADKLRSLPVVSQIPTV